LEDADHVAAEVALKEMSDSNLHTNNDDVVGWRVINLDNQYYVNKPPTPQYRNTRGDPEEEMVQAIGEKNDVDRWERKYKDGVVNRVCERFRERSLLGQLKYGTTLDESKEPFEAFINHAQEELMDAILYLQVLKERHNK
jgi:hypothetical protein